MTSLTDIAAIGTALIGSYAITAGIHAAQEYKTLTQDHPHLSRKRRIKQAIERTAFREETATYSGLLSATALLAYLFAANITYK